ncbi:MAG: hypothetical protein KGH89_05030 [Thaumarchaeota archaeon]|nr:hypothetical protein [Nitrososphaerota archaeon]MDE1867314.1 hypothetical protein [Nitrososphaerota archaeon]
MTVKRKPHPAKHEETRSISYRLPTHVVEELETEAMQKKISQNVLVRQILEKYVNWDRFAENIGMIPVPKDILKTLGEEMEGDSMNKIIDVMVPLVKDWVMFMKGNYDLKRAIEAFEDYMKASGMTSDHRIEGEVHHFIVQHNLGIKWSLFTEMLLKQIFHQFLPNLAVNSRTTPNTAIISTALGSDFSEHSY